MHTMIREASRFTAGVLASNAAFALDDPKFLSAFQDCEKASVDKIDKIDKTKGN